VSKFTEVACYKREFFSISTRNKVIGKNLIFLDFAYNIHKNLLISELLVEVLCKTLDNSTGN